jgi:hypothetical protein
MPINPVQKITDHWEGVKDNLESIKDFNVFVGVPNETTGRSDTTVVNNATIAYINDNGSPAMGIPARPFMLPGIKDARDVIKEALKRGMDGLLKGDVGSIERALMRVGLIAQRSIISKIVEGIPPPLAISTLKARARGKLLANGKRSFSAKKGAKEEIERRIEGIAESTKFAKPLIQTGSLKSSINFVIRRE